MRCDGTVLTVTPYGTGFLKSPALRVGWEDKDIATPFMKPGLPQHSASRFEPTVTVKTFRSPVQLLTGKVCPFHRLSARPELDDQADDLEVSRQDFRTFGNTTRLGFPSSWPGSYGIEPSEEFMAPVDRLIEAVHEYRHLVNLEDDDCTPAPLADIAALNAARLALHAAVELAVLDGWTPAHDQDWRPMLDQLRNGPMLCCKHPQPTALATDVGAPPSPLSPKATSWIPTGYLSPKPRE